MFGFNAILAHQGGWDEMLLVAAPIVVFVLLLRFANQRATKLSDSTAIPTDSAAPQNVEGTSTPKDTNAKGFDGDAPADD